MNLNKNTPFFERILQIIDYYNYSNVNNFAKKGLGYPSSEKINRLKKPENNPSVDIIYDISNKFEDINLDWLIIGRGSMLIGDDVKSLVNIGNENTSIQQLLDVIVGLNNTVSQQHKTIDSLINKGKKTIAHEGEDAECVDVSPSSSVG